jgi:hypothetical protein
MGIIFGITDRVNDGLSYICAILVGIALCFYAIKYSFKSIKERGLGQGALLSVVLLIVFMLIAGGALGVAYGISKTGHIPFAAVIWGELYLAVFIYYKTRPQAEGRGSRFVFLHLIVLTAGWAADRWLGILFYSAPLLFIFHHIVRKVALVTIPASHPDDPTETKLRIRIFLSYILGMQLPLWNVSKIGDREAEKRIDGVPVLNEFAPFPGMIKTHSNQVVGILNKINFRVEGPGVIFTQKGDQPFEIIDLRSQTRTSTIRAFSKEGIPFFAIVNITFKIDCENCDQNPDGIFPYLSTRVKSALYLRSKRAQPDGELERWDDHVLALAEEAAREVLAEHPLIELWYLEDSNDSALEGIAKQIKAQIEIPLLAKGVRVISVKASPDFSLDKAELTEKDRQVMEKIIRQQITAWSAEREQERITAQTDAEIRAEHAEQEAHVQAYSTLLTAIAEGLQVTQMRDAKMVRNIILLRYVSTLENLIHQQPYTLKSGEPPKSQTNILKKIGSHMRPDAQSE